MRLKLTVEGLEGAYHDMVSTVGVPMQPSGIVVVVVGGAVDNALDARDHVCVA